MFPKCSMGCKVYEKVNRLVEIILKVFTVYKQGRRVRYLGGNKEGSMFCVKNIIILYFHTHSFEL